MKNIEIGTVYSDPEGEWIVTKIDGDDIYIRNIQEENPDKGHEAVVSREEVEYFLTHRWWDATDIEREDDEDDE